MAANPFLTTNPFNTTKIYKEPIPPIDNIRVTQEGGDTVVRIPTDSLRRTANALKPKTGGNIKKRAKTNKNKKNK